MEPTTLQKYIEEKVRGGAMKEQIKEQVVAVGWTEDEFDKFYAEALMAIGVPVPATTRGNYSKRASVGDVVLNFFSFILLGIIVSALGTLYFSVINVFFPDALGSTSYSSYYYSQVSSTIHYAIAALIVAFPLYHFSMRMWFKRFREDEAKVESKLTKWLTYLVLLGTSITVVGDLITVLFTMLQGEITARFILKALVVLVLAGMVFGFYFLERRKVQYRIDVPRRVFKTFGYGLTVLVLFGIVMGFVASGGPSTERERRFDEQRSQDLSNLVNCISQYADGMKQLPLSLDELSSFQGTRYCSQTIDPESNLPYEYRVVSDLVSKSNGVQIGTIELCADFALSSFADKVAYTEPYYGNSNFNQHEAGRTCFEQQISVSLQ